MKPNRIGATIVASDSIICMGVPGANLPHVIFSLGGAPEYPPYEVVDSEIWANQPHIGVF